MRRYATRSNLVGALYGGIALGLHLWGRYKSWWWYDNLAHLSAGVALGSLATTDDSHIGQDMLTVVGLTVVWEAFEFGTDTYPWDGSLPDRVATEETVLDSLLVALGAYVASRWADRD